MKSFNVVVSISTTVCIDAEDPDDAIEKTQQALNNGDADMAAQIGERISSPKKPCPFCGAFLENEAPSTIWCHPQNGCLLSLRGIAGDEQIAQWDTRYDAKGKKVPDDAE